MLLFVKIENKNVVKNWKLSVWVYSIRWVNQKINRRNKIKIEHPIKKCRNIKK